MPYTTNFDSKELMQEKLPKDSYFVLGDNRRMSKDSRFWCNTCRSNLRESTICLLPTHHMKIIPNISTTSSFI